MHWLPFSDNVWTHFGILAVFIQVKKQQQQQLHSEVPPMPAAKHRDLHYTNSSSNLCLHIEVSCTGEMKQANVATSKLTLTLQKVSLPTMF